MRTLVNSIVGKGNFEVVGKTGSGYEALKIFEETKPDIVLTDISLNDMNGIETTRTIMELDPNAIVLILTDIDDPNKLVEAVKAGAKGYIPTMSAEKIEECIKRLGRKS